MLSHQLRGRIIFARPARDTVPGLSPVPAAPGPWARGPRPGLVARGPRPRGLGLTARAKARGLGPEAKARGLGPEANGPAKLILLPNWWPIFRRLKVPALLKLLPDIRCSQVLCVRLPTGLVGKFSFIIISCGMVLCDRSPYNLYILPILHASCQF